MMPSFPFIKSNNSYVEMVATEERLISPLIKQSKSDTLLETNSETIHGADLMTGKNAHII